MISTSVIGLSLALLTGIAGWSLQRRRASRLQSDIREVRKDAAKQVQRHYTRLSAFLNVSRLMGADQNSTTMFDSITQLCLEAFNCEQVSLMLLDEAAQELEVRAAAGHKNLNRVIGARLKLGKGIAGSVAETGKPLILGPQAIRPGAYPGFKRQENPLQAAMIVPIIVRDELVGVLNVSSRVVGVKYDEGDLQALEVFAENAGTCIRQLQQTEWMKQTVRQLENSRLKAPASSSTSKVDS